MVVEAVVVVGALVVVGAVLVAAVVFETTCGCRGCSCC